MFAEYVEKLANNKEISFKVKVLPGSGKTDFIDKMSDGTLKIAVAAQPEKGQANQELIKFLATALGVRKYQVHIVSGLTGKFKIVRITR